MIRKAVIPAAGFGTRLRPLTDDTPKELLPVAGESMIGHAVQEALSAGAAEIYIVIREGKEAIVDHFEGHNAPLHFVYQERPLGLGDALYTVRDHIGETPFLMIIPDQLIFSGIPASRQLMEKYGFHRPTVLSSMVWIPAPEAQYFQGSRGFHHRDEPASGLCEMGPIMSESELLEAYGDSEFQLRGFGRTIFPPQIFDFLTEKFINPDTGEVDLFKTFEALQGRMEHKGLILHGYPCDFGTLEGYDYYNRKLNDMEK
jgi:UTP--glucose-1-phosphate uridylyltransferase